MNCFKNAFLVYGQQGATPVTLLCGLSKLVSDEFIVSIVCFKPFLVERDAYLVNYGGGAGMLISQSLVSDRLLASECEKHRVCE